MSDWRHHLEAVRIRTRQKTVTFYTYMEIYVNINKYIYIYIYIQTGSLKTVGQNDIPSRNPVFCVLSGHVLFENLREPDASSS